MGGAASAVSSGTIGSGLSKARGALFGSGEDPGILGTGMYDPSRYDINESAFKDTGVYDNRRNDFAKQLAASQNRAGVQLDLTGSNEIRGRQMTLADQLTAQAAGQGPSLATMQMKQATDRNIAQAMALAASQRGGAAGGLGLRNVQNQQSQLMSQAARDSAMARMQEQLSAREQLSGVLNQTRGADLTASTSQAQLEANQRALNDAQARFYNEGLMNLDMKQKDALMALEKMKTDQNLGYEQLKSGAFQNTAANRGNMISGIGSGIAAVAMSDKTKKKNIKDGDKDIQEFMRGYAMGGEVEAPDAPTEKKEEKGDLEKFLSGFTLGGSSGGSSGFKGTGEAMGKGLGMAMGLGKKEKTGPDTANMTDAPAMPMKAMELMANKGCEVPRLDMTAGGKIPGRAQVKGDSPKNDTVDIAASPGEVVLPRTVAQSGDDEKILEFMRGLKAEKYNYKDPKHGEGTYVTPMAQDLEKSELGKSMVVDTPEGKMVDYARGAGTYLAAAANLNKRLEKVEKMFEGGEVKDPVKEGADSVRMAFKMTGDQKETAPQPKSDTPGPMKQVSESYKKMSMSMKKAFGGR